MPEHIRALIVVLVVGSLVWLLARPSLERIVSPETFFRWRKLWYLTTLSWFLAPNFWVYVAIMAVALVIVGRREPHSFGLYLLLLLAAPPSAAPIPGFGVVDHIIVLNHYRLLALALLLPVALRLWLRSSTIRLFQSPVDWMVLAYLMLNVMLAFRGGNFTNDTRSALMLWIDFFLPYFVASRSIRSMEDFRYALAGLALGGILISLLALTEVLRGWKLYEAASVALGLDSWGMYKTRGPFIRPAVTLIDSIVLGYTVVVAIGAYLYLHGKIGNPIWRLMGWFGLGAGVLASLSRGPWVGSALLFFLFLLSGAAPVKRLIQASMISAGALLVLSFTSYGQQFINLLPFVGVEEQGNIEYRANWFRVAPPVIERHLLFGSDDYYDAPELQVMRQGEGIIDVVNSYLGVVFQSGVIGLTLFVGMFGSALLVLKRETARMRKQGLTDHLLLGRALRASLGSIMFMIFTVSSIMIIPIIYFVLLGLSCAYVVMLRERVGPYWGRGRQ